MKTKTTPSLTLDYVKETMDALLASNQKTSTLDIKLEMRKNGVWCDQHEVKPLVDEVYELNANDYKRQLINNHYYEYTAVVPVLTPPPSTTLHVKGIPSINVSTPKILLAVDMPKMSFKSSELKTLKLYPHQNDWLVYNESLNKYSIFDSQLTRDKVRSKFASLNNVKFQDVRSKRVSNVK